MPSTKTRSESDSGTDKRQHELERTLRHALELAAARRVHAHHQDQHDGGHRHKPRHRRHLMLVVSPLVASGTVLGYLGRRRSSASKAA